MVLFLNGPVQNGDFTFHDAPGKAVGIRLASALNEIQGHTAAPHLWNTVTLSGDIRHRSQRRASSPLSRVAVEHTRLMGKYGAVPPPSSVITDADPEVGTLALTMIEEQLTDGTLRIGDATLQECSACGHTVGLGAKRCTSCASGRLRTRTSRNLIKENVPGAPGTSAHEQPEAPTPPGGHLSRCSAPPAALQGPHPRRPPG